MLQRRTVLLFLGTLLTALGYGATFLLTEHFRTLAGVMVGTFLVGPCLAGLRSFW